MPYSYAAYTGNGATTQFAIPFPYIRKEHIKVYVNTVDTAYTYVNNTTVQLAVAPANGAEVEVRRVTPANNVLVDFTDGSTLVATDLDTSNLQHLYLEQELDDALKQTVSVDPATGQLTANNQRITNVANPVNAQDAATKGYVDTGDALKLNKAGDTMSGPLAMGGNKVTGLDTPTASGDAATKGYVDGVLSAGVPDGDKGDIIVGNSGSAWTIDSSVVTNDKLANGSVSFSKLAGGLVIDSINSTSTSTLATPNSVKTAYDLANAALPKAGGTLTGNVDTTATGYFDLPTGTTAQRPVSPNSGYVRFNTDLGQYEGYNGSTWSSIGGGATGGGADRVFMENDQTITTNYTITASRNAVTAGPVTINAGVSVTVPSGSSWVIV